jgi:hypothetical protein
MVPGAAYCSRPELIVFSLRAKTCSCGVGPHQSSTIRSCGSLERPVFTSVLSAAGNQTESGPRPPSCTSLVPGTAESSSEVPVRWIVPSACSSQRCFWLVLLHALSTTAEPGVVPLAVTQLPEEPIWIWPGASDTGPAVAAAAALRLPAPAPAAITTVAGARMAMMRERICTVFLSGSARRQGGAPARASRLGAGCIAPRCIDVREARLGYTNGSQLGHGLRGRLARRDRARLHGGVRRA